jgi:hypothetical protein
MLNSHTIFTMKTTSVTMACQKPLPFHFFIKTVSLDTVPVATFRCLTDLCFSLKKKWGEKINKSGNKFLVKLKPQVKNCRLSKNLNHYTIEKIHLEAQMEENKCGTREALPCSMELCTVVLGWVTCIQ